MCLRDTCTLLVRRPAAPQDAYGMEKLMTEELLMHYERDFGMVASRLRSPPPTTSWRNTARQDSPPCPTCVSACRPRTLLWQARIARFHNIYGPKGTWMGGREKAPAAFCRKVYLHSASPSCEHSQDWHYCTIHPHARGVRSGRRLNGRVRDVGGWEADALLLLH